jgi:S-DNA-T family DNA segregation ATPase FtsK/SpoIIIE
MTDTRQQNSETGGEPQLKRRIFGLLLFPIALFPFFALVTYNWRDMPQFAVPPQTPSANLIGMAGDYFAYTGYRLIGLAVWAIPLLCVFAGILLIVGRRLHAGRRTFCFLAFLFFTTCFLQLLGHTPGVTRILHALNIEPNAGGAVGYIVMTRFLAQYLSPFGAGVMMALLMLASLLFAIGFKNILRALGFITDWAAARELSEEERAEREAAIAAAQAAKEAARAEREIEKQRIAAEREAARMAKQAAKEAAIREREEEKERERLRQEAEREAVRAAREAVLAERRAAMNVETAAPVPAPRPAAPAPTAQERPVEAARVPAKTDDKEKDEVVEDKGPYLLPPPGDVLNPVPASTAEHGDVEAMERRLVDTLKVFGVDVQPAFRVTGPVVTQYALTLAPGVKPERISSLSNAIQMALEAKSLRIQAPIPGKNAVGIEVPNQKPASVSFREVFDSSLWQTKAMTGKFQVPLLLGKDAAGNDLIADLAKLPHLLVAGATGQGKSVCLNSIINGLLMCRTPEQLKFIMVDPKRVEFTQYNKLPHLLVPVINDTKKVVFGLRWAVVEMEKRLRMFARAGCRNIVDFNNRPTVSQPDFFGGEEAVSDPDMPRAIPYIVIVIDEVADIMQSAGKEVEPVIARLTALARATGIHLILATQRPDAKIITGVIKSNIPGRIAFKTSSSIDSRTILDDTGAEDLIGRGDMLYKTSEGLLLRAQGSYISDEEINRVIDFIGEHSNVQFDDKLASRLAKIKEEDPSAALDDEGEEGAKDGGEAGDTDAPAVGAASSNGVPPPAGMTLSKEEQLYMAALDVIARTGRASTSHLQRRMGIGYNHAARLIDLLEDRGVIGPARGAGPREVLLDPEAIMKMMQGETQNADAGATPAPTDAPPADDEEEEFPDPASE